MARRDVMIQAAKDSESAAHRTDNEELRSGDDQIERRPTVKGVVSESRRLALRGIWAVLLSLAAGWRHQGREGRGAGGKRGGAIRHQLSPVPGDQLGRTERPRLSVC
jgi:hypothetical protein